LDFSAAPAATAACKFNRQIAKSPNRQMTFAHPHWLWALALLPLLALLFLLNEGRRARLIRQLVATRLADRLAGNVSVAGRRGRFLLVLLGLAGAIVALAQPRYGFTWQESKRRGRDVLLAIDTSRSMLATDLAPNRLQRARLAAQDFIGQIGGDRVGLIAFAGTAFLQAPLTADYSAIHTSLQELDTEIIPQGGTNIADAIKAAEDAFGKGESDHRALVIFTDGEELDADGIAAAERVRETIRIFTVGVGSADGALIPLPRSGGGTEFVQDQAGQFVKSRLDETRLRKIAEVTGGFYVRLLNGPAEMQQIIRDGLGAMTEKDIDAKLSRQPIERYQWPLGAALLCLAASLLIGERRRATRTVLARRVAASLLLLLPVVAEGKNAGVTAYEREDFKGALETFAKQLQRKPDSEALHFNHGAAAYKEGEYDRALESFAKAVTTPDPQLRARAEYNLGNTLYQRGAAQKERDAKLQEWRGALQHYDEALKLAKNDENAAHNRELVQKLIEELEKEPPQDQQQPQKDKQKQDKQKQDKKDQEKSDEQQQDGEKKDGEKQDQQSSEGQDGKPQSGDKTEDQQGGEKGDKKDEKGGGEKPEPEPGQAGEKKEGEIQSAPQFEKNGDEQAKEEAANAQAAAEGKMTEREAKLLLDSLKAEDDRVQLRIVTEQQKKERAFRDW
jgi:Ca-activated chloride channel family protein